MTTEDRKPWTPGPWEGDEYFITTRDGVTVACAPSSPFCNSFSEGTSVLISAAPEMADALAFVANTIIPILHRIGYPGF